MASGTPFSHSGDELLEPRVPPSPPPVETGPENAVAKDEPSYPVEPKLENDSNASSKPPEQGDSQRNIHGFKWVLAYASLLSTVLFYALDGTIVADIQPSILDSFGNTENLPWIGTGMFLGALTILPIGKAFGVFNVKKFFLSVVIIFEIGSAVCGAAPNMNALIVGRVIQGVGACGCYSGAITYISLTTTPRERPRYLSGVVATWSLGSVVGPVIGGAFAQSSATWRWAFYINLVVAAVTAPGLIFCLPNIDPAAELTLREKLLTQDWLGMVIFLGGSASVCMAVTFGGTVYAFDSGSEITLWTVSGVLLIAFILVSVYHPTTAKEHRLYPIHLLESLELNIIQFAIFVSAGCMVTTLYYTPLIFQFTRGDGALMAGVRLLPFLGGMIFFSMLNGALMPKLGHYMPWAVLGNALLVIGSALMVTMDAGISEGRIYGYTLLIGGGCGSFLTAGFSVAQALVPVSELNNAIGFMAVAQTMGQTIVNSLAGSLFQNIGVQRISGILPDLPASDIIQLTTGSHSTIYESLRPDQQDRVIEQVALAIRNAFIVMVAVSGLALIGSFFLSRRKLY